MLRIGDLSDRRRKLHRSWRRRLQQRDVRQLRRGWLPLLRNKCERRELYRAQHGLQRRGLPQLRSNWNALLCGCERWFGVVQWQERDLQQQRLRRLWRARWPVLPWRRLPELRLLLRKYLRCSILDLRHERRHVPSWPLLGVRQSVPGLLFE